MNPDSPSKNFIVTFPTDASHTTTSARWSTRSFPSTFPTNRRSPSTSAAVASWTRRSPLPPSSPIDSSATVGLATPRTFSA